MRKNWSQGYCVQTALYTSFALYRSLKIGIIFAFVLQSQLLHLAEKPDGYSLQLQILCFIVSGEECKQERLREIFIVLERKLED